MTGLINSSIGKKFLIGISGLFLITFLAVHLTTNLFLLVGQEAYNMAAHFMATNPVIKIVEPVLAIGLLLHIFLSAHFTLMNRNARPQKYSVVDQSQSSMWVSRNMFVLGTLILLFLILHLANFWATMKFGEMNYINYDGEMVKDAYTLVAGKFSIWWYGLLYILSAIFLGLHLLHGFQSAFQTLGLKNKIWKGRLNIAGIAYSTIIAVGFAVIPLYFMIK